MAEFVDGQAVSSSHPHGGLWSCFCAAQMMGSVVTLAWKQAGVGCVAATVMLLGLSSIMENLTN